MRKSESQASVLEVDRILDTLPLEGLSAELRTKLRGQLAAPLEPVTPLPSAKFLMFQFAVVFALLAAGMIAMMGITGFRSLQFRQAAGIAVILTFGVLVLSLALAWQMNPVSSQRMSAKLASVSFILGFLAGAALLFPWRGLDRFVTEGWPCAATGLAIAVPAAVLFALLARRGAPLSPGVFGAGVGTIAALLGVTVLQFHCTYQHAAHLMVWHGGILVVAGLTGYGVARWKASRDAHRA